MKSLDPKWREAGETIRVAIGPALTHHIALVTTDCNSAGKGMQ
jgi:hypothetical protein